ncbi:MAG: hypothetical protein R3F30_00250 [Planctomycetota bacterium]
MDCKRARNTMQEALDQRLKAAELKGFQEHVLACQACRQDYGRLRSLRQWTRALPQEPVARDFSARLFARIRAGEGSPDAIFAAPIPALRQARVFLSGALTAAALLLGFWLLFDALGRRDATEGGGQLPEGYAMSEAGAPLGSSGLLRSSPTTPVMDPVQQGEILLDVVANDWQDLERYKSVQHPDPELLERIRTKATKIGERLGILQQLPVVPADPDLVEQLHRLNEAVGLLRLSPQAYFEIQMGGAPTREAPVGRIIIRLRPATDPQGEESPRFKPKVGLRAYPDPAGR